MIIQSRTSNNPVQGNEPEPIRHLMAFIDGTWVSASAETTIDGNASNVYNLAIATDTNASTKDYQGQIAFYVAGIGTRGRKFSEGVLASELPFDVENAYTNICLNYIPDMGNGFGDKIYLFGFSRGAIIARLVATLISRFGLLKQSHISYFPKLWTCIGKSDDEIDAFRRAHCHIQPDGSYDTKVAFLGLFDAVLGKYSGGLRTEINRFLAGDMKLPRNIEKCVHILAADENRKFFAPLLWHGKENEEQVLEQIWMPGAHSDIGGGYSSHFLGDSSLLLMIQRLRKYTCIGIDDTRVVPLQDRLRNIGQAEIIIHSEIKGVFDKLFDGPKKRQIGVTDVDSEYASPIVAMLNNIQVYREETGCNADFESEDFPIRRFIAASLL